MSIVAGILIGGIAGTVGGWVGRRVLRRGERLCPPLLNDRTSEEAT